MTIVTPVPISGLTAGVLVEPTDLYPADDTTDLSQAPTGTTKHYSIQQLNDETIALTSSNRLSARVATTGNLNASYNNGNGGVGATLTFNVDGSIVIDGVTLSPLDRILVKDQIDEFQNGIYFVSATGSGVTPAIITRASDFDNHYPGNIDEGTFIVVSEGFTNTGTLWFESAQGPFVVGTTDIIFTPIVGASSIISPAQGGTGISNPTAHTLPVAEGASPFNFLGPLNDGQLLIGSSGADPVPANIMAGSGIGITNGSGTITISNTASSIFLPWTNVTSSAIAMAPNNGYVADNNSTRVSLLLPSVCPFGRIFGIQGFGNAGFSINQNAGQQIIFGNHSTTVGVSGSLASTNQYDGLTLLCVVANTTFIVYGAPQGNLTVV